MSEAGFSGGDDELRGLLGDLYVAAVERVLELHQPEDETIYHACAEHVLTRTASDRDRFTKMDACPDCTATTYHVCSHCPPGKWPCPTYRAIATALSGGKGGSDEA